MRSRNCVAIAIALVLVAGAALAQSIPNWTAPPYWTPPVVQRAEGEPSEGMVARAQGMTAGTQALPSSPLAFTAITPCRVADTRTGSGFSGQYGPPILSPGNRDFTITGQCGIPSGAVAVSFNFTIINTAANGDIRTLPAGGTIPQVSTMNWTAATQIIANAAVVPLGTGGAITVRLDGTAQVNLIIDVNGYYAPEAVLASGQTRRGTYTIEFNAAAGGSIGGRGSSPISFPLELASAPSANIILAGGSPTTNCPGSSANPTAAPGNLCVYESTTVNISFRCLAKVSVYTCNAADTFGTTMYVNAAAAGMANSVGTWAVTAP